MLDYLAHHSACAVGSLLVGLVVGFFCLRLGANTGFVLGAEKMKEKLNRG
jgi:hypothetical protein